MESVLGPEEGRSGLPRPAAPPPARALLSRWGTRAAPARLPGGARRSFLPQKELVKSPVCEDLRTALKPQRSVALPTLWLQTLPMVEAASDLPSLLSYTQNSVSKVGLEWRAHRGQFFSQWAGSAVMGGDAFAQSV